MSPPELLEKKTQEERQQEQEQQKHYKVVENIQTKLLKDNHPIHGSDDDGYSFDSIEDMWKTLGILLPTTKHNEKDPDDKSSQQSWYWYEQAEEHYEEQPPTLQGMLGGFASLSPHDLSSSYTFLIHLQTNIQPNLTFESICDCGAGIGRITKGLFWKLPGFQTCDLVEGSSSFLQQARVYLKENIECKIYKESETPDLKTISTSTATKTKTKTLPQCRFIPKGLQHFHPQSQYYNVIWIQWVIGYLTDYDCVLFFQRCAEALKEDGILCLKDNMIASKYNDYNDNDETDESEAFTLDREDSSVTRSKAYLEAIIEESGCWTKIYEERQEGFPREIFPVWMMAYKVKR